MKKKLKITAGFLTVIVCVFLGCEKRERERTELFLEETEAGDAFSGQGEAGEITPGPGSSEEDTSAKEAGKDSGLSINSSSEGNIPKQGQAEEQTPQTLSEPENCVVHICGAVNEPGVYTLEKGDRIYQAIEKAGGFRQDAEQNYLNQADVLSDGMKIYVPTQEEAREAEEDPVWVTSGAEGAGVPKEQGTKNAGENPLSVNINTASQEQLCTLPGVGSSKAKSIIAYREQNGAYQRIEDIMNVEGIKEGVFQKIKDHISVS